MSDSLKQAAQKALEACPFCDGTAAFVPRAVNLALQKDPSNPVFGVSVICSKCGAESANMVDESHAAAKWNSRSALLQQKEEGADDGGPEAFARQEPFRKLVTQWLADEFGSVEADNVGKSEFLAYVRLAERMAAAISAPQGDQSD